jgi:hypothetical protein
MFSKLFRWVAYKSPSNGFGILRCDLGKFKRDQAVDFQFCPKAGTFLLSDDDSSQWFSFYIDPSNVTAAAEEF